MKLVYGFGINNVDYITRKYETIVDTYGKRNQRMVWCCPFYKAWVRVLARVFSKSQIKKNPSYLDCSVSEEWRYLSNFKAWMETQDWQGKELDKDILTIGNKVYGPDTCVFIDRKVNSFILASDSARGIWPIGVYFDKTTSKFSSQCFSVVDGKKKNLGRYNTPEEAHKVWLDFKLKQAYILASEQKDERVAKALIDRYENFIN